MKKLKKNFFYEKLLKHAIITSNEYLLNLLFERNDMNESNKKQF